MSYILDHFEDSIANVPNELNQLPSAALADLLTAVAQQCRVRRRLPFEPVSVAVGASPPNSAGGTTEVEPNADFHGQGRHRSRSPSGRRSGSPARFIDRPRSGSRSPARAGPRGRAAGGASLDV